MYTVYVIEDENSLRYIGQTENIDKRLEEHNSGLSFYTKRGKNWKIIYTEEHSTRSESMRREKYLKSWKWRDEIRALIGS